MTNTPTQLVPKLWSYYKIPLDEGLPHGVYVKQLTFLPFLKMADDQPRPPFNKPSLLTLSDPKPGFWSETKNRASISLLNFPRFHAFSIRGRVNALQRRARYIT
jgi:hypothetical protein